MAVTILIPTYFGNKMVESCVSSILKNVKNPKITLYKNDIGWLQACNELMKGTEDDVILLNDDTYVTSDIITEMSSLAYSDPNIGIVGGKALSPNGDTVINYGIHISADGNSAHKYFGKPRTQIDFVEKQKAVEGSCMFIKREVLNKIGFFDENYGKGYREEVDLCFRAREAGYKVVSCPTAEYIHFVSQTNASLGITNDTYDYFMTKWGTKLQLGKV